MDLLHALFRWICATISANFHFESHFQRKNTLWWMKSVQLAGKILKCVTLIRGGFKCTKCPSIQPVRKPYAGHGVPTVKLKSQFQLLRREREFLSFNSLFRDEKQESISALRMHFWGGKPNALQWVFFWNFTEWCKLQAAYMVKV